MTAAIRDWAGLHLFAITSPDALALVAGVRDQVQALLRDAGHRIHWSVGPEVTALDEPDIVWGCATAATYLYDPAMEQPYVLRVALIASSTATAIGITQLWVQVASPDDDFATMPFGRPWLRETVHTFAPLSRTGNDLADAEAVRAVLTHDTLGCLDPDVLPRFVGALTQLLVY